VHKTGKMVPMPFPSQDKMAEEQVEAIPPRFNSASTLKVEVKPGENTADVESKRLTTDFTSAERRQLSHQSFPSRLLHQPTHQVSKSCFRVLEA
jgi:hypothetical protein